jgi:hypothetical protein
VPCNTRDWIAILWPAFVSACLLEMVVFAAFDPHDLGIFGWQIGAAQRDAVYSLAFFAFWAIASATGVVTWSLSRSSEEINRRQRTMPLAAPLTVPQPGNPRNPDSEGPNPPPNDPPGAA